MIFPVMLLEQQDKPFTDANYQWQVKYDGIRLVFAYSESEMQLFTRHGTNVTKRFPEIASKKHITKPCILDGELIVYNPKTKRDDFSLVMERFSMHDEYKIRIASEITPATFMVFDVLQIEDESTVSLPFHERNQLLDNLINKSTYIQKVTQIHSDGELLFNVVKENGLEGIVGKRLDSKYLAGKRSSNGEWIKVINHVLRECYITGIRKGDYGVYISTEKEGEMKPVGCIEVGISRQVRREIYRRIEPYLIAETDKANYCKPIVKVKVKAREETAKGNLRIPLLDSFID